MIKWIRTSRLSIKNSLSTDGTPCRAAGAALRSRRTPRPLLLPTPLILRQGCGLPRFLNHKPYTINHKLLTMNHTPGTKNPKSSARTPGAPPPAPPPRRDLPPASPQVAPSQNLPVIRKEAWLFCRTSSGFRQCWELEEPKGPQGRHKPQALNPQPYTMTPSTLDHTGVPHS